MKNNSLLVLIALILLNLQSCTKHEINSDVVHINLQNMPSATTGTIFIKAIDYVTIDSLRIEKDGVYDLKLPADKPQVVIAYYESSENKTQIPFLVANGVEPTINFNFEGKNLFLREQDVSYLGNNPMVSDFVKHQNKIQEFSDRNDELQNNWKALLKKYNNDGKSIPLLERKPIDDESVSIIDEKKTYFNTYVQEHNDIVTLYIYNTNLRFSYDFNDLDKILSSTPDTLKNSLLYKNLLEKKEILKNIQIGAVAPEIVKMTPAGESLALSSLRGKYVLLDFWASWCAPCRKENPWVKKAYDQFHQRGFDVYAVSFDYPGDADKWKKAIDDDKLIWNHVSSLQGWNDPVTEVYNISGIPAPFLLDPDGKIIAKGDDLREQNLIDTLQKYLDDE